MSLVVGEAIAYKNMGGLKKSHFRTVSRYFAYKRIFKPISPCKNNWEFVCRSETISD